MARSAAAMPPGRTRNCWRDTPTKRLKVFLGRPLGELDRRVVCIDGKVFRDHCLVISEP